MIRNFIRQFGKKIQITQHCNYKTLVVNQKNPFRLLVLTKCNKIKLISLHSSQNAYKFDNNENLENNESSSSSLSAENSHIPTTTTNILDSDEYVTSYVNAEIKNVKPETQLRARLGLKSSDIEKMIENEPKLKKLNSCNLYAIISIILDNRLRKRIILDNPLLLTLDADDLKKRVEVLKTMDYMDINDVAPLLQLSPKEIKNIVTITKKEYDELIPHINRIYFLSYKLKVEPYVTAKHISKRLFMFRIPLGNLIECLDIMLEFGIESNNILKDLWSFRYPADIIRARLQKASYAKKSKLMPWMVRCPEYIFQNSLKLSLYEKQLLGEKNSIIDYLSQRLELDTETIKSIVSRNPVISKVRIKKVKEVLDYLLNEAQFSSYDIARAPRILCHKLETTKLRLKELKSYGCRPSSLIIVCRSKREYEKFVRNWLSLEEKFKTRANKTNS